MSRDILYTELVVRIPKILTIIHYIVCETTFFDTILVIRCENSMCCFARSDIAHMCSITLLRLRVSNQNFLLANDRLKIKILVRFCDGF